MPRAMRSIGVPQCIRRSYATGSGILDLVTNAGMRRPSVSKGKHRITSPHKTVATRTSAVNPHTPLTTYIRGENKGKSHHVGNNYKLLLFNMAFLSSITPGRRQLRVRPYYLLALETPSQRKVFIPGTALHIRTKRKRVETGTGKD